MKITPNDRRFVVVRCSDKKVGVLDYFVRFNNYLDEEGTGDHVYTWLKKKDLSEFKVNQIPMTEEKQKLIEFSRSKVKEFVEKIWKGELDNELFESRELILTTEELVDRFGAYFGMTYEEVKKQHKSEQNMKEVAKEKGQDMRVEGTTKRVASKAYPISARRFVLV